MVARTEYLNAASGAAHGTRAALLASVKLLHSLIRSQRLARNDQDGDQLPQSCCRNGRVGWRALNAKPLLECLASCPLANLKQPCTHSDTCMAVSRCMYTDAGFVRLSIASVVQPCTAHGAAFVALHVPGCSHPRAVNQSVNHIDAGIYVYIYIYTYIHDYTYMRRHTCA